MDRDEEFYHGYITESLRSIPQGKWLSRRWIDIVNNVQEEEDKRTADEIVQDVIKKAGLTITGVEDERI